MGGTLRRLVLLFFGQLPAFYLVYALLPGYGIWIFIALLIWILITMTWFAVTNRHSKKQWLYLPLALIISVAGQLVSWIIFLFLFLNG